MSEDLRNEELENYDAKNAIILLTDEEGNDIAFEFLDLIKYQEDEYVVLSPVEEEEDEDEESQVMILRLEEETEDGGETYVAFDDQEILEAVYAIFKDKWKDKFNFTD